MSIKLKKITISKIIKLHLNINSFLNQKLNQKFNLKLIAYSRFNIPKIARLLHHFY